MNRLMKICIPLLSTIWLASSPLALADDASATATAEVATADKNASDAVDNKTAEEVSKQRERIVQEAVDALAKTRSALKALEEKHTDKALEDLAVATGKLELIVARDPDLALAPTGVVVSSYDVSASKGAIKKIIKEARSAIADGDIQVARRLLENLSSEVVISVSNLPLATYPDAIKAITPMIDSGDIEGAKAALEAALNTLVVNDYIVPLPVIRAEAFLEKAETLTEKADRSDDEKAELADLLKAARGELEMAQLLGYGNKADFKPLYTQLSEIEKKTKAGESGTGFFDKLKGSMSKLWD